MDISLQTEIAQVQVVDSERNYWFIRTYGGKVYDYFREHDFMGLGFNKVPNQYIKDAKPIVEKVGSNGEEEVEFIDPASFTRLKTFIANNTKYKKGDATKWANQLIDFEHVIKVGDLVIYWEKEDNLNKEFNERVAAIEHNTATYLRVK